MRFWRKTVEIWIKDPSAGFLPRKRIVELRKDPLTGKLVRINIERARRPHEGLKVKIEKEGKCPFCPKNVEKMTPKFTGKKERYVQGNSILFPNLYPFGENHAIVVLTKKHSVRLGDITEKDLFNAFQNCMKFFEDVCDGCYPSINFNFLPPSGASILHPHFQIMAETRPTSFLREMIRKSKEYWKKTRSNFWKDIVEIEREKGERFISTINGFHWIADFAPLKNNQLSAIIDANVSCFLELDRKWLRRLSRSLSTIFKCLDALGIMSVNMAIFSGLKQMEDYFLLNLKIVARKGLGKCISDMGFMEVLHGESVVETIPEDFARKLKASLKKV